MNDSSKSSDPHGEIISASILCVDDDLAITEMVSEYLKQNGFRVITAQTAEDAMDLLSEHHFDIVITDVMMPGINGLELTEWIKKKYDSDVIVFTGYAENCNYDRAMTMGATDFWYKPFKFLDMLDSVNKVIDVRRKAKRD